jgi:phosphomannomutase
MLPSELTRLLERARAWIRDDSDPRDAAELTALVARAETEAAAGDGGPTDARRELAERFAGPLKFGTAGLRGLIGAGEQRMNSAVVRRATFGLLEHVMKVVPNARSRGVAIARDGRDRSEQLQREAAEVTAAFGVPVHFLPGTSPTPLLAFSVKALGAAAGVMITASHNPPRYNGYKVYLDNGAQIIPPHDQAIAAAIDAAPAAKDVPARALSDARSVGLVRDRPDVASAYLDQVAALHVLPGLPTAELRIAYTALHGVGEALTRQVFQRLGYRSLVSVAEQAQPDGRFPTVSFPNPEEPEAMERVLALAQSSGADIALAQDPDADRLAAAARDRDGRWVVLSGNEIGVLLAHHLLTRDPTDRGPERLVITTVVSSTQLSRIARELGVRYQETLTGFKWIANAAIAAEPSGARFVFGYEEALGYTAGTVTRDKDGIGAAVVFAELAAAEKAAGHTVLDRLRAIRERFGLHVARQKSLTFALSESSQKIGRAMEALRAARPKQLGEATVETIWDLEARTRWSAARGASEPALELPRSEGLIVTLAGGDRVAVRPSGTEPKLKFYFERVETLAPDEALEQATARGNRAIDRAESAIMELAGLR